MNRFIPLLLAFLLLTGCGVQTGSSVPTAPADPPPQEEPAPEVITPESLREEYEKSGEFTVREIVPYEGDFLVYYGNDPYGGIFQWVYTDTGFRAPLLFSVREILSYEIIYPGCIRVLEGGTNIYNGARGFPVYEYANTSLPIGVTGEDISDLYASGSVEQQTYWAPVRESHLWGWDHGEVSLVDVRVTARGIEAVFGPTADNIGGFFAAASSAPVTETVYDEVAGTLTLIFQNTVLSSGVRTEFTDEDDRKYYMEYQEAYGLPTSFPAGILEGENLFLSRAEVRQAGTDTHLILTLTEVAQQYTSEGGQLLRDESRPWMGLSFREERNY